MKFITVSLIIFGIIIIFNAGGIDTPAGGFVTSFLEGGLEAFKQTLYWTRLKWILTGSIVAGAVAGLYTRAPPESYLIASLVFTMGGAILSDLTSIYLTLMSYGETWMNWIVTAIFIPLYFVYFIVLISFWRGTDY